MANPGGKNSHIPMGVELAAGIEPATSPLPRECSTPEPRKRSPLYPNPKFRGRFNQSLRPWQEWERHIALLLIVGEALRVNSMGKKKKINKFYNKELRRLQVELVKLQEWLQKSGLRVVILFEGRDAAGKGGVIKRITSCLNPRGCRVVALGVPTERERTQWYFQRYVQHLPAAGEMVLFDRSWYNRAGVEQVMGFCTDGEYREFLQSCPEFEQLLMRSGLKLIKYWFSISDEEQERRFQRRLESPVKRWKLSPMDLQARDRWVEYSKAKDQMFLHTDSQESPWNVVDGDSKKRARLNCMRHLLESLPYEDLTPDTPILSPRKDGAAYKRTPFGDQNFVPDYYKNVFES